MNDAIPEKTNSNNNIIAFTWSPKPSFQMNDPQLGYAQHLTVLRGIRLCCKRYEIHPEFFANGGLHYHGKLEITDKIKWFAKVLPTLKRYGFVVIKTNVDDKWTDYIRKDVFVTNPVLTHMITDKEGGINLNIPTCKKKQPIDIVKSNFIQETTVLRPQEIVDSSSDSSSESTDSHPLPI